ncbi:hypothetical protein GE09DRAFT_1138906 [Coniochaeta sp. 2T2.1]|nr:hypothetical protein GE09DRAFT_1138906 [Coniochaeta sp. 2T2.1]
MRSQVTRNVCRRLVTATTTTHQAALSSLACSATVPVCSAASRPRLRQNRSFLRRPSRRTFFGLFQKPPRELKEIAPDPGYETLINFRSCEAQGHRLPPREELIRGFQVFFQHKLRHHKTVNSTQALLATGLLRHLRKTDGEQLSLLDLRTARDALLKPPKQRSEDHLELAKELYEQIRQLSLATGSKEPVPETEGQTVEGDASAEDFSRYITSLTLYGGSVDAAAALEMRWRELQADEALYKDVIRGSKFLWVEVLRGLAEEGRERDLLRVFKKAEKLGVDFQPTIQEVMVTFYATRDRVEETKKWFELPIPNNWLPLVSTYREILRFAVRNGEQEWVNPIFADLRSKKPRKALWDIILQWAILCQNAGPEDMLTLLKAATYYNLSQKADVKIEPDTTTLNSFVEAAILKNDPYLAERLVALGATLGIPAKARTHLLQMDYRISAGDLSGARAAYELLETQYITDEEDLPIINRYIRALCASPAPSVDHILDVTRQIEHRGATLEPETVVSLCLLFLRRDKEFEVIDTLTVHTTNFSLEERAQVEKAFVAYCLDKTNSTARVWDAYTLLRQFFPESPPTDRVSMMDAFFQRKRPDMAAYVFGHMRAAVNPTQRPTVDTYVRVFEGFGKYPDLDSLKLVHNMLKMDTTVTPDTRLYNALMIAYLGCGEPYKAYEFWNEITASREGPTYRSLEIVFRVCEALPWGDRKARDIWGKMARMDLDVPKPVFSAYCGAIAGQGRVEEVKKLITGNGETDVLT